MSSESIRTSISRPASPRFLASVSARTTASYSAQLFVWLPKNFFNSIFLLPSWMTTPAPAGPGLFLAPPSVYMRIPCIYSATDLSEHSAQEITSFEVVIYYIETGEFLHVVGKLIHVFLPARK